MRKTMRGVSGSSAVCTWDDKKLEYCIYEEWKSEGEFYFLLNIPLFVSFYDGCKSKREQTSELLLATGDRV